MSRKVRFVCAVIIIILISWFDFQYLSQFPHSFPISENIRRISHLLLLIAVMLVGGFAWAKSPVEWVRALWWYAYLFALAVLFFTGLLAHFMYIPYNVLYAFYKFRIFFCSPLPFFILYIFSKLKKN
ncbi:MAG: hypothetical protein P4L41_17960 [Flavipsychrobacter sp.]|nr:hypothetical protein [Flavipsychrobacter sp.]